MQDTMHTGPDNAWRDRVDDAEPRAAADDLGEVVEDAVEMVLSALRFGIDRARTAMNEALRGMPEVQAQLRCEARTSAWTRHYSADAD